MKRLATLLILTVSACHTEEPASPAMPVATDSAGVHIVEYPASSHAQSPYEFVELLRAGDAVGSDGLLLSRIAAGEILSDGSFVVADQESQELVRIASDATLVSRQGGEGEGPGEFEFIRGMGTCSPEGFTVFDLNWTMSRYDATGRFISERAAHFFEGGGDPYSLACDRSGRLAVINWDMSTLRQQGFHVATGRLRLLEADGSEIVDLGERIGSERFGRPRGSRPHPMGRSTRFGFLGSDLIVADGTFFGFERWNREGRLAEIVRLDLPPLDGNALIAAYRDQTLAPITDEDARRREREIVDAMAADAPPQPSFFLELHIFDRGILMQETSFGGPERWFEFRPDGAPVGYFELPEGARLLDARGDRVLVEERGALDVPRAVLYARIARR